MQDVLVVETHPDDLVLSMGACTWLHNQVTTNRVYSISVANGGGSGAQAATGLSTDDFIAARDDEMKRANRRLGIRYERIIIPDNRPSGGLLTPEYVAEVVGAFVQDHPGVWVKAQSPLDAPGRHPDHVASGRGVQLLHQQGVIDAPRYYIEPYLRDKFVTANPGIKLTAQRATNIASIQAAFQEYILVDRPAWKFGIGGTLSVPKVFAQLLPDPVNYWHM